MQIHMQGDATNVKWFLHEDKCFARVPPKYVPQLQLHMLATGLQSALFVSRTSRNGTRIFRMTRDDDYCKDMLALVSRFHREFVCACTRPPLAPLAKMPRWERFCKRTEALSMNLSKPILHIAAADVLLGQSQPMFL
jgi:hypothetical protein